MHWGLYSLPAGEWKGQQCEYIGEWIQSRFRIPGSEYGQLAKVFNPIGFDAEEIVKLAKECGMRYIVLTSKHHEGFAMYHSQVDSYNIYDATPFHRDPIAEIAEACYKHGIRLGLYYSQDLDWHEPDGGGYTVTSLNGGNMHWTNDWDFPDNASKDYTRCFENKIKPQVKEILTKFGPLCLIWFDTPRTLSLAQSQELYDMVKHYQPDCLVNSRIGNGLGDYSSLGDNQIPAAKRTGGLFETAATLNDTWGYKSFDQHWKTPEQTVTLLGRLASRNVNYLLNVGPDHLGRIPADAQRILRRVGEWIEVNGEAIYGTDPSPFAAEPPQGPFTISHDNPGAQRKLYWMLHHPQEIDGNQLALNGICGKVEKAVILGQDQPLELRQYPASPSSCSAASQDPALQEALTTSIVLPELEPNNLPVVELTLSPGTRIDGSILQQPDGKVILTAPQAKIDGPAHLSRAASIEDWTDTGSRLQWDFTLYQPGDYRLEIRTNGFYSNAWIGGHELVIRAGDASLKAVVQPGQEIDPFLSRYCITMSSTLGVLHLGSAGRQTLTLAAAKINPLDTGGLKFVSLYLTKV